MEIVIYLILHDQNSAKFVCTSHFKFKFVSDSEKKASYNFEAPKFK